MISADLEKVKQSWACFVPERKSKLKIISEKSNGKVVLCCYHLDVELASNKSLLSLVGIVEKTGLN